MGTKQKLISTLAYPIYCLIIITLFSSCSDEELDFPFKSAASINYYLVSDVLETGYSINDKRPLLAIFADGEEVADSLVNADTQYPNIPYLNKYAGQSSFPYTPLLTMKIFNEQPSYMAYEAKKHSFLFAFTRGWSLNDTDPFFLEAFKHTQSLTVGTYYCYYITDVAGESGDIAGYNLVVTEQPRQQVVQDDKVAVRFINLSPDAGALNIKLRSKDNSSETSENLPQELTYGQERDYVLLGTDKEQDGLFVFNVYNVQDNELMLVSAVPISSGHSFEVLLHGFVNETERKVPAKYEEGKGVTEYRSLTVSPNFRATVRQTF